jgi:hypothetical protein
MMTRFDVAAGTTIYVPLMSYDSNGASVALSGLAVTDVEIYKNGSVTQRASDAGITLLDTDGISIDSVVGYNGFSIDLSDNTDASFYAVGSEYHVIVASVTIDTQTVNSCVAWFRIVAAEGSAGTPKADVSHWLGTAAATPTVAGVPEVDVTHWIGTAAATPTTAGVPEVDVTFIAGSAVSTSTAQLGVNVVNAGGTAWASGSLTSGVFASGAITAAAVAADAIGASELAADAVTEIVAGVWGADATTYQTQGTFGQAIGDPVADTNTIFKATVTDATGATVGVDAAAILADTGTDGVVVNAAGLATDAVTEIVTAVLTTQMTEAYATDGSAPTLAQSLCLIQQMLGDFSISGTTLTVKKVDGSTSAATFTLNDGTSPTAITRAT